MADPENKGRRQSEQCRFLTRMRGDRRAEMVVVFSSIKEGGEGRQILGTVDLLSVSPSLNINLVYSYCFPLFPPFLLAFQ